MDESEDEWLDEGAIMALAEAKVFARGIDIFASADSLGGLHRQGSALRGWCLGSEMEPIN